MPDPVFFEPNKTYRHYAEDGRPSEEGLFQVVHVGRAPEPFEHYSETLGVAFGWRQGVQMRGAPWEGQGAYTTADFAGWREVPGGDGQGVNPDGCRWCGEPAPHGFWYVEGIGLHQWAAPSDRQRLGRMQARQRVWSTRDFIAAVRGRDPVELETGRGGSGRHAAD
jgi:hypothetical protein